MVLTGSGAIGRATVLNSTYCLLLRSGLESFNGETHTIDLYYYCPGTLFEDDKSWTFTRDLFSQVHVFVTMYF